MSIYRIEVTSNNEQYDSEGRATLHELQNFGLANLENVRTIRVYTLCGDFAEADAQRAGKEFFADAVVDIFAVNKSVLACCANNENAAPQTIIEIRRKNGVMDPSEQSIKKGLLELGIKTNWIRCARKFIVGGKVGKDELKIAVEKLLANIVIEDFFVGSDAPTPNVTATNYIFKKIEVPISHLTDDELLTLSKKWQLYLSLSEMKAAQNYFKQLNRAPTDIELETIAQTWSEHCGHKTFRGVIEYTDHEKNTTEIIDNLLKTTVAKVTHELNKKWCWSVFVDNSGVIEFTDDLGVGFKVETHNHPSAIEPYGGAGTGIGGCIRDPMGTGLGGKPILNTDIFCFGIPTIKNNDVPKGCLHPRRVLHGVVSGVRDYGNRMGIPTVNGAVYFDERYTGNPLVFCGNLALIPKELAKKRRPNVGDIALVVGGGTGRDGIHGATFSSVELDENSEMVSSGAVQIGNPIEQKKVLDFLLRARDENLYSCITDCGAGGLSSALGEMGEDCGVEVDLEKAPLKYAGLSYTEIWISEAQERMVLSTNEKNLAALEKLAREENVTITPIARFRDDQKLVLRYQEKIVGELTMDFLHNGCPRLTRQAIWHAPKLSEPNLREEKNYGAALKEILGAWNVCSKEWIIRQYDHEVQGASVVKPLTGIFHDAPSDAAVIAPILGKTNAIAVACGLNPKYSDLDPYWMAANAIDEALRNIIAVGGNLNRCALLDNFCWGNCDKPDRLAGLVRAAKACYDIAKIFGVPFISGKDSLNNEYGVGAETICIPGTLLISAVAIFDDCRKAITSDAKAAGNLIYVIGKTYNELGGSHFYAREKCVGKNVPIVRTETAKNNFTALSICTEKQLVRSLHDCSEGGIAVALAEMAFGGDLGMEINLRDVITDTNGDGELTAAQILFSESASRLIAEVAPNKIAEFESTLKNHNVVFAKIGMVTTTKNLRIFADQNLVIGEKLSDLKSAWQKPLLNG